MGSVFYSGIQTLVFRPLVAGLFRGTITGEDNIPDGPALLASNHIGAGDPIVTSSLLHRPITYSAKAELFTGHYPGRPVVAWFLRKINTVPVNRSGGRASREVFAPVLEVLGQGGLVGIYPEGTRSPDGYLHKGKTGVARIALAAGVPVVPMAMFSSETIRPIGIPWISHPRAVIGKPLDFGRFNGGDDDHGVLRWVTDEIMNAIMAISGQEYVDVYGASVKSGAVTKEAALAQVRSRPGGGPPPAFRG